MKLLAILLLLVPSSAYAQSISFGNVTTAAPAYLTGTNRPFSLDLNGNLRTIGALPTGAATSANQTNAGQKTQIVDGSGNVIASTSNNLNVQCANCSGSGVSAADEAVFTAGTTLFAAGGGFFQTTATNNALTTGQQGAFQLTANRALFSNLRNAAGTEVGTASTPLQVSLANTAANGTAVSVSLTSTTITGTVAATQSGTWNIGTVTTLPALPANQSVNVAQINGVTPLMGNGITGTGSQRVTIASDNTAFSVNAAQATAANLNATVVGTGTFVTQSTLAAETTKVIGTIRITGNVGGVLDAIGQNVAAPANWLQGGCQFNTSPTTITNGNGSPLQCDNGGKLLSTVTGTVTVNAGTNLNTSLLALEAGGNLAILAGTVTAAVLQANVKQINGVVPLMGNGITGTGSQRVTIASDNTAFSVNAAQSGTWTVQPGNTANTTPWLLSIAQGGNTAAVNASSQLSVNCANCSGSGVSQQDATGFTFATTNMVPIGGTYSTSPTVLASGQAGVAQATANRAIFENPRDSANRELGASLGANSVPVVVTQVPILNAPDKQQFGGAQDKFNNQRVVAVLSDGQHYAQINPGNRYPVASDPTVVVAISPLPSLQCPFAVGISQTASTQLVTGKVGQRLHICTFGFVSASAQNVSLVEGTGSTCGTGTGALAGGTTASIAAAANGGLWNTSQQITIPMQVNGDNLCLLQSAAGNVSGTLTYGVY